MSETDLGAQHQSTNPALHPFSGLMGAPWRAPGRGDLPCMQGHKITCSSRAKNCAARGAHRLATRVWPGNSTHTVIHNMRVHAHRLCTKFSPVAGRSSARGPRLHSSVFSSAARNPDTEGVDHNNSVSDPWTLADGARPRGSAGSQSKAAPQFASLAGKVVQRGQAINSFSHNPVYFLQRFTKI